MIIKESQMKFVLAKSTFTPTLNLSYAINPENLLGHSEQTDPLVMEYIISYTNLLERVGIVIPTAEVVNDDPNDVEAYLMLPFTNENDWNNFLSSREMAAFLQALNNLYPKIGWAFHGFKTINQCEEPLIKTKYEFEKIWNSN